MSPAKKKPADLSKEGSRKMFTFSRSSKKRRVCETPTRSKMLNDLPPLGGLSKREADAIVQAHYRIVAASDISQIKPERVYDDVVRDGKVSTRSDWKDISKFAAVLETHFPDFAQKYPQLGNFLRLDVSGKMAGAAFHQLLARVCEGSSRYTMFFLINGMVARLSPVEFSMISGLRFMDERTDDERVGPKDLKQRMFPKFHSKRVPFDKLIKKITQLSDGAYGPPDDHPELVNLIFVWLVTTVLLFDRSNYVSDEIFEICTDLDICEKYPWGVRIWEATVVVCMSSMHPINGNGERNWNASGFPFIVVYWMIEALEGAQNALKASARLGCESAYPRMLRWCLGSTAPNNKNFSQFLDSVKNVFPRLKPSSWELQSGYFYRTMSFYEQTVTCAPDCLRIGDVDFCTDYVQFHVNSVPEPEEHETGTAIEHEAGTAIEHEAGTAIEHETDTTMEHDTTAGTSFAPHTYTGGPPDWWVEAQRVQDQTQKMQYDALKAQQEEYYRKICADSLAYRNDIFNELTTQRGMIEQLGGRIDLVEEALRLGLGRPDNRGEEEFSRCGLDRNCEQPPEQIQTWGDGFNAMEARFDGLEEKVNTMCARFKTYERKWVDLRQEGLNGTKTVEEMKQENLEAIKSIEKLRLEKSESDKAAKMYKTRLDKLLPSIKKIGEGLSEISSMKVADLVNLQNDMRELVTHDEGENLGFPDSRDKTDSLGNGSMPDDNAEDVAVLLPGVRLTSNSSGCRSKGLSKNGDRNSPQPWTREHDIAHTVKNSPGLQSGHNPQPQSEECIEPLGSAGRDIIEILDNDDETNPNGAVETSKRVVGSNEMNLVQRSKRNRTESMGNSFAFSTTKRKQAVRTVDEDKTLIHDKRNEVLKSSHDRVDFSPSGRRVEKAPDSQNGLSDEVSADSEDGSLSDSRIDNLIASLRGENRVKTFLYEADMLQAFQQDEELCLNAVCALYRRKFIIRNSNGFTLSINRGFSPIDSMSGCAMAEYLIDGDKELRLTKSVAQVKRQRPDVITLCRKLAIVYVEKLFEIYNAGDDPLFCQS